MTGDSAFFRGCDVKVVWLLPAGVALTALWFGLAGDQVPVARDVRAEDVRAWQGDLHDGAAVEFRRSVPSGTALPPAPGSAHGDLLGKFKSLGPIDGDAATTLADSLRAEMARQRLKIASFWDSRGSSAPPTLEDFFREALMNERLAELEIALKALELGDYWTQAPGSDGLPIKDPRLILHTKMGWGKVSGKPVDVVFPIWEQDHLEYWDLVRMRARLHRDAIDDAIARFNTLSKKDRRHAMDAHQEALRSGVVNGVGRRGQLLGMYGYIKYTEDGASTL